jgi:UDP-glucose 4-epimerase
MLIPMNANTDAPIAETVAVRADGRPVRYYQCDPANRTAADRRPPVSVVTGADGYVGRAVAAALAAHGEAVAAIAGRTRSNLPAGVETYSGSASFAPAWEAIEAQHRIAAIYHCTRLPEPTDEEDGVASYRTHVAETLDMLARWPRAERPAVVLLSSAAVYGGSRHPWPAAEHDPARPASPYAASLHAAEAMVAHLADRWMALRVFEVVGPDGLGRVADGGQRPWSQLAAGGREGLTVEDSVEVRDYVALAEVGEAFWRAGQYLAEGGTPQVMNVGTGHGYALPQVIAAFSARRLWSAKSHRDIGLVANPTNMESVLGWAPAALPLAAIAAESVRAMGGSSRD